MRVRTYTGVVSDTANSGVDGRDLYWYSNMDQEMEDVLVMIGWHRQPRTDDGAEGLWIHPKFPTRTIMVHAWRRCWNTFCINDEHPGDSHVDSTGRTFYDRRATEDDDE